MSPPQASGDPHIPQVPPAEQEWLVTNGLGGYASGTVAGRATRRYHGLLIGAYPPPHGRVMLLTDLAERVVLEDGRSASISPAQAAPGGRPASPFVRHAFALEEGLPVWRYEIDGLRLERRLVLVHGTNRTVLGYRMLEGRATLVLEPLVHLRSHDAAVDAPFDPERYAVERIDGGVRIRRTGYDPMVRLRTHPQPRVDLAPRMIENRFHAVEEERGYASVGSLWSPGRLTIPIGPGVDSSVVADDGTSDDAPREFAEAHARELERRRRLIVSAGRWAHEEPAATLVRAADAFLIAPRRREGSPGARTVIAGYHWFTDWGRDTMIALEGLTLVTGRGVEAREILRMFGAHVRRGLIPNLFPEGDSEGLYHTADATLWFIHALARYERWTGDEALVDELLPIMRDIVAWHIGGTDFGIGVDPLDGLLRQGAEGYQLTWMDAKVDGWVVTPRRGKAVEINALWYNALRILGAWEAARGHSAAAEALGLRASGVFEAFNRRFWIPDAGWLYDVIDGEQGDDPACRPNQLFAIALPHPVLDPARWESVLDHTRDRLLTPVGLRSLDPEHPDYRPWYFGDLRARDAAYHQGTVWGWLIGPYVDAWLRVHPGDVDGARECLTGLIEDLQSRACLGSISEIYDAEPPHTPRGCVAQAWSVAEALRCWALAARATGEPPGLGGDAPRPRDGSA